MRPFAIAAALFLSATLPAAAQDETTFTTEDAALMTTCIESLSDQADASDPQIRKQTECVGVASNQCMETEEGGYSTMGMVACMARETDWWDSQLNASYTSLRETLEPGLFETLQQAQRSWIDYRDQTCGFEYDLWGDGSMRNIAHAGCMQDETARRAEALAGDLTPGQ